MFWVVSSVIATLARTGTHVLNKKVLKNVGPLTLTTAVSLLVCFIYSPVFVSSLLSNPVIATRNLAFLGVVASAFLNSLALVLLMKALKLGDVSVVIPLRNLVPLFVLAWGAFFLGESIKASLVPATLLIVIGAMLLHLEKGMKLSLKDRASLLAVSTAVLYSIAIVVDKFALAYIEPVKYTFLTYLGAFFFLLAFSSLERKLTELKSFIRGNWKAVLLISVMASIGSFFTFTAISLADVTMVAPILRLEVLFSVVAGGMFFKEENILVRALGAVLLFAGVLMVILA